MKESKVITNGGEDYRYKLCRCSICGVEKYCTPENDFYVPIDQLDNGLLVCEPCLVKPVTNKPILVMGGNPEN